MAGSAPLEVVHLGELKRIEAQPGDVFVLTPPDHLPAEDAKALARRLAETLGHPVVVLPAGVEITVARKTQVDGATVRQVLDDARNPRS